MSPSFDGFKPDECKPHLNRQYDTDEEEFGESNELDIGFRQPCSVLLTPKDCDTSYFLKIKEV